MLSTLIHEIKTTNGTLDLNTISRKLDLERSTIDGMILTLLQMGILVDESQSACPPAGCGGCASKHGCPFAKSNSGLKMYKLKE